MMHLEQITNGTFAFIENEILPTMSGGQLWGSAFALGILRSQANAVAALYINKYGTLLNAIGLLNESGEINIESAIDSAKVTAKQHGKLSVPIPFVGTIKLSESSFDSLYKYIIDAGKN